MKILKNIVLGSAIASLTTSLSAAVIVSFSWTGASSSVVSGTISFPSINNTGTPFSAATGTLLTLQRDGFDTASGLLSPTITGSFVINGTTGSLQAGSSFFLNNGGEDVLVGTQGTAPWSLDWEGSVAVDSNGDTDLALTVVPEPETYAAVAGAGLVAFGLFRRRATKA